MDNKSERCSTKQNEPYGKDANIVKRKKSHEDRMLPWSVTAGDESLNNSVSTTITNLGDDTNKFARKRICECTILFLFCRISINSPQVEWRAWCHRLLEEKSPGSSLSNCYNSHAEVTSTLELK